MALIQSNSYQIPYDRMRVLLYQSARGLFSPSGGYKSNLTVLQHLASRGHTVAQIAFAYEHEIQDYAAERRSKGFKINITRDQVNCPIGPNSMDKIRVTKFTMHDGVRVIALDVDDVEMLFPKEKIHDLTRAFVEVCIKHLGMKNEHKL